MTHATVKDSTLSITFDRWQTGAVSITLKDGVTPDSKELGRLTVPAEEWARIVAAVSQHDVDPETQGVALWFHGQK